LFVDKWLVTIPGRFNSHEKGSLYQLYRRLDGLQNDYVEKVNS
jgi:hypothetical protein